MISHFIRRRRVRQNNCNHIYEHYNFKISKTMVKSCQIEIGLQFPPFSTSYQFIWVFHLGSQPFFHNYCDDILSSHRSQSPSTRCKNDIYLSLCLKNNWSMRVLNIALSNLCVLPKRISWKGVIISICMWQTHASQVF